MDSCVCYAEFMWIFVLQNYYNNNNIFIIKYKKDLRTSGSAEVAKLAPNGSAIAFSVACGSNSML